MVERAFVDLHCHTRASFNSLSSPEDVVRTAARRGLTHLAITDHDRIDGALRGRDAAPDELTVIVGEEVKTADGDLICLFLECAVPPGRPAVETIAAVREQGGLVGIPHPFDRFRRSLLRESQRAGAAGAVEPTGLAEPAAPDVLADLAGRVDWVEAHNARVLGSGGNEQAALFARDHGLPGVAVSDAHTLMEVGVSYTIVSGDPSTPEGLVAALAGVELVTGHASYLVRGITPIAKVVQRMRGNGRVPPADAARGPV